MFILKQIKKKYNRIPFQIMANEHVFETFCSCLQGRKYGVHAQVHLTTKCTSVYERRGQQTNQQNSPTTTYPIFSFRPKAVFKESFSIMYYYFNVMDSASDVFKSICFLNLLMTTGKLLIIRFWL